MYLIDWHSVHRSQQYLHIEILMLTFLIYVHFEIYRFLLIFSPPGLYGMRFAPHLVVDSRSSTPNVKGQR